MLFVGMRLGICDTRNGGDEAVSESTIVWVSHQQMAPHSNLFSLRATAAHLA